MRTENTSSTWFPDYVPQKKNTILVVISDNCFADAPELPVQLKDKADAEVFFKGLRDYCLGKSFNLDYWGTPKTMSARLTKKYDKLESKDILEERDREISELQLKVSELTKHLADKEEQVSLLQREIRDAHQKSEEGA